MADNMLRFLRGYVRVALCGYSPERFLNLCQFNHMELWNLSYVKDHYEFCMSIRDFKHCKTFVKKSKTRLRIVKRFGLPFFVHEHRKRKLFFAGMFCGTFLLFYISLFIWDISFEGNTLYTDETLIKALTAANISYGTRKAELDCDQLEQLLRSDFPKLTWVSAEITGTCLKILVNENTELMEIPAVSTEPCHLVASKAGEIVSVYTRAGIPQIKAGDLVEEGQLLIDGALPVMNDSQEVVLYKYVRADADILAKTEYTYEDRLPVTRKRNAYTGKSETSVFLKVADFRLLLHGFPKKFGEWDTVFEEHRIRLSGNFYLPVSFGTITRREYVRFEEKIGKADASLELNNNLNEFLNELEKKGLQIIEKNVRIVTGVDSAEAYGTVIVIEPIAIQQNVIQQKENGQTDELTGDNH